MTERDLDFLVGELAQSEADGEALRSLAADPEAVDRLLDSRELFERLLQAPRLLHISPYFFYYVLVRRVFLDHGIDHRVASDYVGSLLSYHAQRNGPLPARETLYMVDLIRASVEAHSPQRAFELQAEAGNRALYLAGLFPDWIYHRFTYGRRPVNLDYYEEMGRSCYAAAARTEPARRHDLGEVLGFLAQEFPILRQALNDLVDEHLHLAPRPESVDRLCRQALYRVRN
ncbi:MAG: hypothetical protein ACREMD_10035 [Gemmatimonadota bacterium]